jgi:ribonucleoside-diphosphate reductase beta chain
MSPLPTARGEYAETEPSLRLYRRWERQQWSALDFDFEQEALAWSTLSEMTRRELRHGMLQFFLGEVSVTDTLAPIAHAAPTHESQIFLCTQMADEARHTVFFQSYLNAIEQQADSLETVLPGYWAEAADAQRDLFDSELPRLTDVVRNDPGDRCAWYEAITLYHLMLEGVLAVTGQKILIRVARALSALSVLEEGLTQVARDESRHVAFGVEALKRGVDDGHGNSILAVVRWSSPLVVRTLVQPERRASEMLRLAAARRGAGPDMLWEAARLRLQKRLHIVGLDRHADEIDRIWRDSREGALAEYADLHGEEHPART